MKHLHQLIFTTFFCCLISTPNFALAPVVDDSENFAILDDEAQAGSHQPVANNDQYAENSFSQGNSDDEKPLAHDEPVSANQGQSRVELLDKVQGMQQDIQELRGQLEMQSHELKLLKDQQLSYYKDLDARLHQAPTTPTVAPAAQMALNQPQLPINPSNPSAAAATTTPSQINNQVITAPIPSSHGNPADEQLSYMAAYELIKNKQFDKATSAMQAFVTQYPNGGYTANAQYWLGELYMVQKSYPEAIQHFEIVLNQYPNSSKAAASLLKVGYALAASGKGSEAKQKLNQVIKNYPDSPTAQLAAAKLKTLNAS